MASRKKKKRKKSSGLLDFLLTFLLVVAVLVFAFAAYNLYHIYSEYKKGTDEYNAISEMVVSERDPEQEEEVIPEEAEEITVPMTVDFAALQGVNSDVIGWIYVEALDNISYPLVKGQDNSYYLHMTYQKNYNFAGTIFADCTNAGDFSDCNTILYGHNMKNGSMFGMLSRFVKNEETYKKSPYFWIFTPDYAYRYEIVSAYTTGVTSDTYTLFKGPGAEFKEYLQKIVDYSELDTRFTADDLTIKDKVVTLSTCTGDSSTRFVVQGVRVDSVPVS